MMSAGPVLPPELLPISACRSCGSSRLDAILDLGSRYMVDFPATPTPSHQPLPLEVWQCRTCQLVQLAHTAPAEWRYATYYYRSGTNEVMREELADVVALVKSIVPIGRRDAVLDIGANDGTLLRAYDADGATPVRIAVEPAENMQAALRDCAHMVYPETWPLHVGHVPAHTMKAITSIAMLYGADDLNGFVERVAHALAPEGVWVVQFQDLLSVLNTTAVDWFVHEHLVTFSLWTFAGLCHRHGLQIQQVERRSINGGSLRVVVRHRGVGKLHPSVQVQIERERDAGLLNVEGNWAGFLVRVQLIQTAVKSMIEQVVREGGVVDLYAASTKASLLLQLIGLDKRHIRQAIERQAQKVGRYVGASGIPIVSEETMRQDPPTALLLGAWQFREAFIEREQEYLSSGGVMIVPLPHPEVVRFV